MLKRLLLILLLITSVLSFTYALKLIKQRNTKIDFPATNGANTQGTQPIRLTIPTINMTLPIIPASISKGSWEYTDEGVSYLQSSPIPGELGNSIIYGHNWDNILGNLDNTKVGDTILIQLSDNREVTFKVTNKFIVTPDQTHVLDQTDSKKLTIYTCTGFLDSKRLVVTAELI